MASSAWKTSSTPPISESLRGRAEKRSIEYWGYIEGSHHWSIPGSTKLGDAYDEYQVKQMVDGETRFGDFYCDCQNHQGGQYRTKCSHKARVMIWIDEEDGEKEMAEAEKVEPASPVEAVVSVTLDTETETYRITPSSPPSETPFYVRDHLTPDLVNLASPDDPPLPAHFTEFRVGQDQAILEIMEAFESGVKVVFLSAPTGAGKTLIGESVRRMVGGKGTYTCTTKSLQRQILGDYDYGRELKGRANYVTLDKPEETADSCTMYSGGACWSCSDSDNPRHCHFCHPSTSCPYVVAKKEAVQARLAILNVAYLLREINGRGNSAFRKRSLYIMDEGDEMERQLMSYVEVALGPRTRKMLGLGMPDLKSKEASWVEWVRNKALPAAQQRLHAMEAKVKGSFEPEAQNVKTLKNLESLVEKLGWLLAEDRDGKANLSSGWVMDVVGGKGRYQKGGKGNQSATLVFKPVKIDQFVADRLWRHGDKWLMMSATWVGIESTAEDDMGLRRDEYAVVHMDSPFPVERRPVVVQGVAKVTGKKGDPALEKAREDVGKEIERIMGEHPDQRILVHTVSYDFAKFLEDKLTHTGRIHTYSDSYHREQRLEEFLADPRGVILAPSFERGIDLPHDDCRVIIIAKVPYPYLGDEQIQKRKGWNDPAGQRWYDKQTIRSICQMTGRGMRSEDDWCLTYILDSSFSSLFKRREDMFPRWWTKALVKDQNDPRWRGVLEDIREGKLDE